MKPIVFAGPSVHRLDLPSEPGFDLTSPAGCGDVAKAVRHGRRVIGLIDGLFESGPAVWHKEILFALASGCTVLGASSMGAIRAAECAPFGMIGIGQVFNDYLSGRRCADADVALVHGPAELGYLPLSVALVDVDDAVRRMQAAGIMSPALGAELQRRAAATFFKSRSWQGLLGAAGVSEETARGIRRWIADNGPGLKSRDALLLLQALERAQSPRQPGNFQHTRFFTKLLGATEP